MVTIVRLTLYMKVVCSLSSISDVPALCSRNSRSEIPNITGTFTGFKGDASGAFKTADSSAKAGGADIKRGKITYNASRGSDGNYGNYTEVRPLYLCTQFLIKY